MTITQEHSLTNQDRCLTSVFLDVTKPLTGFCIKNHQHFIYFNSVHYSLRPDFAWLPDGFGNVDGLSDD